MARDGTIRDPAVVTALASGSTLADAMRRVPSSYPAEDVALVEAGEQTGRLDPILDRLAAMHERRRAALGQFKTQMGYPLLVFHMGALMVPFGLISVLTGRIQVGLSLTVTTLVLGAFWGTAIAVAIACRDARKQQKLRDLVEKVPGIGMSLRYRRRAVFTMVLEASYESGVKLDQGVRLAAQASQNTELDGVVERIAAGTPLGEALAGRSVLAATDVARLATAERAGELSSELQRLTTTAFENAEIALTRTVGIITKGFYTLLALGVFVYAMTVIGTAYGAF
jgi:type IV pilus assembly protein PilC